MAIKTRIGVGSLTKDRFGSVTLPEDTTMCCPQCGTLVADKGQCIVNFQAKVRSAPPTHGDFIVFLEVDCRNCGYMGEDPALVTVS